jgi:SAM-dependent methyltransferase
MPAKINVGPPSSGAHRFSPRGRKPFGQPTRGKTAPNRLRPTDTYLALCYSGFIRRLPGLYVDLGYGETPQTTRETASRLSAVNPEVRVLGVEIDPQRVTAAQPFSGPRIEFRRGGFNLPLQEGERAAVIRAMNVLRQYPESEYGPAVDQMGRFLCPGGILLEGTSSPEGGWMVFHVYRRNGAALHSDGLVFFVRRRGSFEPRQLQAVLPKDLIHRVEPGGPLDRFFGDWEAAARRARRRSPDDPRRQFQLAALSLAADFNRPVDRRATLLRRGFLRLAESPLRPRGSARKE